MPPTLQDNQFTGLKQEFPASTETSVTALLQQYRAVNGLEGWEEYTTFMHAVAAISGNPQAEFQDAQYAAWAGIALP